MTEYQPWDDDKRRHLIATARQCWHHYPGHTTDPHRLDNCAGCALERHNRAEAPNYAGWLRIYIELGKPVYRHHYNREIEYALEGNRAYYDAIMRDIATFGIKFKGE